MVSAVELRIKKRLAEALDYDVTQREVAELKELLANSISKSLKDVHNAPSDQFEALTESLRPMIDYFQRLEEEEAKREYEEVRKYLDKGRIAPFVKKSFIDFVGSEPERRQPEQTFTSYPNPQKPLPPKNVSASGKSRIGLILLWIAIITVIIILALT